MLLLCEGLSLRAVNVGILSCYAGSLIEEKKRQAILIWKLLCSASRTYGISLRFPLCPIPSHAADNNVTSRITHIKPYLTIRSTLKEVSKRASCTEQSIALSERTLRCPGQRSLFVNITTKTTSLLDQHFYTYCVLNINPMQLPTITHYHLLAYERISVLALQFNIIVRYQLHYALPSRRCLCGNGACCSGGGGSTMRCRNSHGNQVSRILSTSSPI